MESELEAMSIRWPPVRRGSSGRRSEKGASLSTETRPIEHLAAGMTALLYSLRSGGCAEGDTREKLQPTSNWSWKGGLSKIFLEPLQESDVYHHDTMPQGLRSARFLRSSGICIPLDFHEFLSLPNGLVSRGDRECTEEPGLHVSVSSVESHKER